MPNYLPVSINMHHKQSEQNESYFLLQFTWSGFCRTFIILAFAALAIFLFNKFYPHDPLCESTSDHLRMSIILGFALHLFLINPTNHIFKKIGLPKILFHELSDASNRYKYASFFSAIALCIGVAILVSSYLNFAW